jgi:hypothetical protein
VSVDVYVYVYVYVHVHVYGGVTGDPDLTSYQVADY